MKENYVLMIMGKKAENKCFKLVQGGYIFIIFEFLTENCWYIL